MDLALITPITHLDMTEILPGRFCIASVAKQSQAYLDYFKKVAAQGFKVILDTGVFESQTLSDEEFLAIAAEIEPSVLVIPDIIGGNAYENWTKARNFATKVRAHTTYRYELMFVPQCERGKTEDFWDVIDYWTNEKTIRWLGICRDAVFNAFGEFTGDEDQELNRFYFATELQRTGRLDLARAKNKRFHFLGIGDQVHLIKHFWFVDSMDTASFFWQGYLGSEMTINGHLLSKLKRPKDYFTRKYSTIDAYSTATSRIVHNCRLGQYFAEIATNQRRRIEGARL